VWDIDSCLLEVVVALIVEATKYVVVVELRENLIVSQ
jgi:hypothetical protein